MNAPLPPDPYKALGVEKGADAGTIKTAYRKLVLKCHPDKFPDPTLKAVKQEEFQRVQQAYEILGSDDKKQQYDLEVKARKLRDELYKNAPNTSAKRSYDVKFNVNIRTAEPPSSFATAPNPPGAKAFRPPYSDNPEFTKSWERDIPTRSRAYHEDDRKARRTASYEKPKREEETKEDKRRRQEQEREYQKEKERDIRRREKERDREREREKERERQRKLDRELQAKQDAKAERKRIEREREARERERERLRRQEAEEKTRSAKSSKPYVEPYIEEEDEDVQRSRAKKSSSSSKKHGDSSPRKSSSKPRERSPLVEVPREEKLYSHMQFAAEYLQASKRKGAGKAASPTHQPDTQSKSYPSAYPDPDTTFHSKTPRRSGEGKHGSDDPPIIVDVPGPSPRGPDVANASPPHATASPPRLQKSNTMPAGHMPQAQTERPRIPLSRAYTMQPELYERSHPSHPPMATPEKDPRKSYRRRASFDEGDYYEDEIRSSGYPGVSKTSYKIGGEKGAPRVYETAKTARFKDPYAYSPGASFSKVKVAPNYGTEHVQTSKAYDYDDVNYFQPHYATAH